MAIEMRFPSSRPPKSEEVGLPGGAPLGLSVAITAVVVVLGLAAALVYEARSAAPLTFAVNFERVATGMYRDEVLEMLGTPDGESVELYLGKSTGLEAAYEAAANSSSDYYLVWRRGRIYSIGMTKDHRVAFKALAER